MRSGAKGIKTQVSGRLGGADIARAEHIAKEQFHFIHFVLISIMLQQKQILLMVNLGVKVWIYRGEVLPTKKKSEEGGK